VIRPIIELHTIAGI